MTIATQTLLDLMANHNIPLLCINAGRTIDYESVPVLRMQIYMMEYVEFGIIDKEDFLWALVTNNLKGVYLTADNTNVQKIKEWVDWLYNKTPGICWGSEWKVVEWCKSRADYRSQYVTALQSADD